jgi:DNA-dependent protein kinase catalytic subunit
VRAKKWDEAKRVFSLICADLFDPSNPGYGSYNKKFATQFAKHIESYFGKEGAKLPTLEPRKFEDSVNDLSRQMDAAMMQYMKSSASSKLTEYSTWLSRFDESEHSARGVYLELPGQYTGKCKPQPEYHIRISRYTFLWLHFRRAFGL